MVNIIVVFLGAILTGVQTVLLLLNREAICFNEGCEVVESLTKVSPVVFNIAGCLFFLALLYSLIKARKEHKYWPHFAKMLLIGGMAVEGVLLAFQYIIADVFCSYCLLVGGFVLLANLLAGIKHFLKGISVIIAIFVASLALEYSAGGQISDQPLVDGNYGYVEGTNHTGEYYLFFSETCPHCEDIIEELKGGNSCEIRFNPVANLSQPPLDDMIVQKGYNPQANVSFLKNLGINEIPVLFIKKSQEMIVYKGKRAIQEYLDENCMDSSSQKTSFSLENGESSMSSDGNLDFLIPPVEDENCQITTDTNC